MAHQPKPFFRTGRGWFVQLGAKQIKLCDGPKTGETEKTAWAEFYKFMAERAANDNVPAPNSANSATLSVAEVFEKFLGWCQQHRSPAPTNWHGSTSSRSATT